MPKPPAKGHLRRRAELLVAKSASAAQVPVIPPEDMRKIVHELQVHQVELELQNEELRHAQVELFAARSRYFDLYDLAPVGYCTLNTEGLIIEANLTVAGLFGVGRKALVDRPISRYILKEDQDIYYHHRRQLSGSGSTQSCELRMRGPDGAPFWALLVATVAKNADGVDVHRLVVTDISDRVRLELAMRQQHTELEDARASAQRASNAKSEFLSRMSHELRTPLNAILGFAQLLENDSPSPSQQADVAEILRAGWYLLDLINEILDLAAIESEKVVLALQTVSLSETLVECQSMIGPAAKKAEIAVTVLPPEGTLTVLADPKRLKQVLLNLLSNGVKYNRRRGTVVVSCSYSSPTRVRIAVRDSGTGLSREQIAHLFEPFNRLGQERSDREGTGIGLVVSRRLVEAMEGEIGVESAVGEGSTFWVELQRPEATLPQGVLV